MALRSKWTIRVHRLETLLRVGMDTDEQNPQPITVNLRISGLAESHPDALDQCFDYKPICRWILEDWPQTRHTPLLETRFNELVEFVFAQDKRVMDVCVGLYKVRGVRQAEFVGLEREVTRRQYQEQLRQTALPPTAKLEKQAIRRRSAAHAASVLGTGSPA
jgi:dihydroneopterin aldolase